MAENAREFLGRDDGQPFFLYFCPTDPHRAPGGFANEAEYPGVACIEFDPAAVVMPPFLPDRPEVRAELAEYHESVARFDQGVGKLLEALRETGHWDDTLVLLLSDNGIAFPGAKTTLYEPGVRLPLVVRAPGQRAGLVSQAMISWVDLVPTILEWTGAASPPYTLHGRSFLSVLDQEQPEGWDEVYGSHTFHEVTMYYPVRSVRTRQYKCLLNLAADLEYPFASDLYESATWQGVLRRGDTEYGRRPLASFLHRPQVELYDLEADPDETKNLAEDPALAETRDELLARLRAWQERTADPWQIKYEHE
jgi:N-sulfoglucosamine sulfohydrolase